MAQQPPEVQKEAWRRIAAAMGEFAGADGRVRMQNVAICAAGEK
jgi:hypothetical protein